MDEANEKSDALESPAKPTMKCKIKNTACMEYVGWERDRERASVSVFFSVCFPFSLFVGIGEPLEIEISL